MRRAAAAALAGAALLAGCGGGGGGGNPKSVLSQTARNLSKIRGGTLHVELTLTPNGKNLGGASGFELDGPVSLSSGKRYPTANLAYTQLAAGKRETLRVVSDGTSGYVEAGGRRRALTTGQLELLRRAASEGGDPSGGVGNVIVDRWLVHPKLSDGGEVGGADTDRVHAALDVVQAVNGLLPLAPGSHVEKLTGANADRLAQAVRSSSIDVYTGKKDRLLRRVTIDVDFALDVPKQLRTALGDLVGARFHFLLGVAHPRS